MKIIYHYTTTTDGKCYVLSYDTKDSSTLAMSEEVDPITKEPIGDDG